MLARGGWRALSGCPTGRHNSGSWSARSLIRLRSWSVCADLRLDDSTSLAAAISCGPPLSESMVALNLSINTPGRCCGMLYP